MGHQAPIHALVGYRMDICLPSFQRMSQPNVLQLSIKVIETNFQQRPFV